MKRVTRSGVASECQRKRGLTEQEEALGGYWEAMRPRLKHAGGPRYGAPSAGTLQPLPHLAALYHSRARPATQAEARQNADRAVP